MRYLLLSLTLLLAAGPAVAQRLLAATRPDSLPAAQAGPGTVAKAPEAAAPDTVAAIHRLFAKRRLRRNLIASSLGASALVGAIISGSSENNVGGGNGGGFGGTGISFSGADYLLLYAIPAAPLILIDYVVYANYARKREAWVLEEFQAHRLPARLRHKLKPRYFR